MNDIHVPDTAAVLRFYRSKSYNQVRRRVMAARQRAEQVRKHVNEYQAFLFKDFRFTNAETGEPITTIEDLYLIPEAQEADRGHFYALCIEAHKANGYDVPSDYCPALQAERDRDDAESELIRVGAEFFGLDAEAISALADVRQMLKLLLDPPLLWCSNCSDTSSK